MRREPNPAHPHFGTLEIEKIERIVKIALYMVEQIALGKPYSAYEEMEWYRLSIEEKAALYSCLNSAQRSVIRELAEAANES